MIPTTPALPFAPLTGIRVLDMSKVLAGPMCGQYLADLGASVIKVEPCDGGDDTRSWPPLVGEDGAVFLSANRNKRSIAVNLKTAAGHEVIMRLLDNSDVLLESYRKGAMERLGLGYETLRERYPRLIYASISGFGRTGPLSSLPGYDVMTQAFSGIMGVTGEKGGAPVRAAFSPLDQTTGIWAALGILAALRERDATGMGRFLEVSLYETAMAFMGYTAQIYWQTGRRPERCGSGHESLCPYQVFPASDGEILIAVGNDSLWRNFCDAAGLIEIKDDPRFRTNADRVAHFDETVARVTACTRTKPVGEWTRLLGAAGVPNSPIHSLDEVLTMPHTAERGIVMDYQHAAYGPMKTVAMPVTFDATPRHVSRPPPQLGEHTAEILAGLGYVDAEIEHLQRNGVVRIHAGAEESAAAANATR
ncbi:CaiB/BaiF CoA transferase family protein [Piscinibacter sakaiensis]|uniref:CaiB/BaiF CoA transferase family protein n=1 Tax=Piscinibacter sakaiensis TaxID=1547922 RepID=UPI003AAE42AD